MIGPEQAVALLTQGRVRDLNAFADKHDAVPSLEEAASSKDWRWRFVAALGCLFISGDRNAVAGAIEDAPNRASRAAACVVTACTLMDAERHADAVKLLSEQRDDASPVDWAWTLAQRACARAEIGDVAAARQDAAALRALVGDPDDITGSAIGAAAGQLLFQTAPWGEGQLDELITANDTAVSWWRTQTLASGFAAAADRAFRGWADERATRIEFEDAINDRMFAAVVSADLTGEQRAWRTNGSLLARNTLIVGHAQGDTSRQTGALDELRRSGDAKSLELAARRLWAVGPLGPLAEAARRIHPGSRTHTTARANLALWQHAGDVMDETTATEAARYCLDVLTDDSEFVARTTPSFLVIPYTLDALSGLLGAADDALHRDLARLIVGLSPVINELEARGWAQVAAGLRATVHHDEEARELLLARVADGDNDALAALGPVRQLDAEVAKRLMAQDAELLDAIIAEVHASTHVLRTRDPAARLAILGSYYPHIAPWDALLHYLAHTRVPGERKGLTCQALAHHADRLPEEVRSALRNLALQLRATVAPVEMLGAPLGGTATILAAAVGGLDDQTLTSGLTALLTGSRQERRDAAELIGRLGRPEFTSALVALVSDSYADVRAQAAHALAFRVASSETGIDRLAIVGLQRALADPGALVSLAIAGGVAAAETPGHQARELIAPLLGHASARVREATRRLGN